MRQFTYSLLCSKQKDLEIAEIGVQRGENALNMVAFLPIKKLHLIDPYTPYEENGVLYSKEIMEKNYEEMLKKMAPYMPDKVTIYELPSVKAAALFSDQSLDAIYIDANHERVEEDIKAWFPKLKVGGLLGGHDFKNPVVAIAISKLFSGAFTEDWVFDKIAETL